MAEASRFNPYLLCLMGAALLTLGFLMGPFPVLVMAGLAPLFALSDYAEGDFFWNKLELVGVALFVGIFSAYQFNTVYLLPSLLQAIAVTFTFAAFNFTRQNLGSRLGKLPLILYLLALEYLVLKAGVGQSWIFWADSFRFKSGWTRWTVETGYLGISLWVLAANLVLYLDLRRGKLVSSLLIVYLLTVIGPIIYSDKFVDSGIDKKMMLADYATGPVAIDAFSTHGEWIPRTAAWVSALILVFAFVKSYIQRK